MDLDRACRQSWNRMRAMLFAPFDIGKWARLGFVAWLSSFLGGGGSSFSFPWGSGIENRFDPRSFTDSMDVAVIGAIVCGVLLLVGVVLLAMMWVGARGQFMFLDNVVHDRSEIPETWRRYREPGNGFFKLYVWLVSIPVVLILLLILVGLVAFWSDLVEMRAPGWGPLAPWILVLGLLGIFSMFWSAAMLFYREFGVPVMMKTGCSAREAVDRVWAILRDRPADSLLFLVLRIALGMLFGIVNLIAILCTCCLGGLPYVNAVLTLPIAVFRQSFILECLRDLAPEYDLLQPEPPPSLPEPTL